MFEALALDKGRCKRFGDAMICFSLYPSLDVQHLADNHPFEKYTNGTFVDIGGSHGTAG